jgi:hypothetical protein
MRDRGEILKKKIKYRKNKLENKDIYGMQLQLILEFIEDLESFLSPSK